MRIIHQHVCSFIPPHILERLAETTGPGQAAAIATLDEMQKLSEARPRMVIDSTPKATAPAVVHRNVYDAHNHEKLPGTLVMSDRNAKRGKDAAVLEAWDGAGATYDFFSRIFRRNSIDGAGLRIDSTVHYGRNFNNAMWANQQMIYGDGDGKVFNRFTAPIDVVGHELTHGVTQHDAGLGYQGQNGALNEHISDAFGIMLKQAKLGQKAEQSNWLIGEGLFTRGVNGRAIRSMREPGSAYNDPRLGKDPQPAHMKQYNDTPADHGGVHINSGIPNRAFYLASVAIGGYTWERAGTIWYETLRRHVAPLDEFIDFADATTAMAGELFGGDIQQKVFEAWRSVGLTPLLRFARFLRQRRKNDITERKAA